MKSYLACLIGSAVLIAAVCVATIFDSRQWLLLRNTYLLAGGTCLLSLPLGTALAFLLTRTDFPARRLAWISFTALLFVPLYLQAAAWDAGLGKLGWLSIIQESVASPWLDGMTAAIWIHGLASVPWVVLFVSAGLRMIRPELEEEALLNGGMRQVFFRVTMPRALVAVAIAAVWVFLRAINDMTVTDLYQVRTFAEELYTEFSLGDSLIDIWSTAIPGVACSVLVMLLIYAITRIAPADHRAASRDRIVFTLGNWRLQAIGFVALAALLLIGVPLGNLIYKAGWTVDLVDGQRIRGWSFSQFSEVMLAAPGKFHREIGWTLAISTATAVLTVAIAAPLAWFARSGGRRSLAALMAAVAGLALPAPLIALSIIWLMNRESPPGLTWLFDRTITAPVLSATVVTLPIAIGIAWYGFRSLSNDVLESAATEGAGNLAQWLMIAVPMSARTIATACLASFAVAAGDLAATILVVPPNVTTVQIRVFGLLHAGVEHQVAALSLLGIGGYVSAAMITIYAASRVSASNDRRR